MNLGETQKNYEIGHSRISRQLGLVGIAGDQFSRESHESLMQVHRLVMKHFDNETPHALFSFSGGIVHRSKTDKYRSLAWSDVSELGVATGGRTRVIATAEIAQAFPDLPIITNSFNRLNPVEPTMASVIKNELVQRGVNEDRIQTEEASFSTISQLTEMIKLAAKSNWQHVAAVVNEYYIPRVSELYKQLDTLVDDNDFQNTFKAFKASGGVVAFISAEPILRLMNPHFGHYLDTVEQSPAFRNTVAREAQGLQDLQTGKYRIAKPRQGNS